jgi:hypothetical protein
MICAQFGLVDVIDHFMPSGDSLSLNEISHNNEQAAMKFVKHGFVVEMEKFIETHKIRIDAIYTVVNRLARNDDLRNTLYLCNKYDLRFDDPQNKVVAEACLGGHAMFVIEIFDASKIAYDGLINIFRDLLLRYSKDGNIEGVRTLLAICGTFIVSSSDVWDDVFYHGDIHVAQLLVKYSDGTYIDFENLAYDAIRYDCDTEIFEFLYNNIKGMFIAQNMFNYCIDNCARNIAVWMLDNCPVRVTGAHYEGLLGAPKDYFDNDPNLMYEKLVEYRESICDASNAGGQWKIVTRRNRR